MKHLYEIIFVIFLFRWNQSRVCYYYTTNLLLLVDGLLNDTYAASFDTCASCMLMRTPPPVTCEGASCPVTSC